MTGYAADERGTINSLLDEAVTVTEVYAVKGAACPGHVHMDAPHWMYVVSGRLLWSTRDSGSRGWLPAVSTEYAARDLIHAQPGTAHAWQPLEDTVVLLFTAWEAEETLPVEIPLW